MRKQKALVSGHEAMEAILAKALVLRLAMCKDGQPYVVPLSFGLAPGRIYCHTGRQGLKMDFLAANDRVCFEAEAGVEVMPGKEACAWGMRYESVVGFGRAVIVDDPEERLSGLRLIMEHYAGKGDYDFPEPNLARTAILRIDIEEMTGRRAGF
ncbi:hypothetical protein AAU61_10435 [Desulfocarbo indianensis]|nr:hypothetical protein AAU61_10435 [Desulfocarbo indianensis]